MGTVMAGGGACPLCGGAATHEALAEAGWLAADVSARLAARSRAWAPSAGACPDCVQRALLERLASGDHAAFHEGIQAVWPLDPESAFGALPTPLRMHADPRYTGAGVTLALVDAGFHPHPDLVRPVNRIRAWADAGHTPVRSLRYAPNEEPAWPGSHDGAPSQWHGLMTSAAAAGNGRLSRGFYRGLASDAGLVLVQAREPDGYIGNGAIARALAFVREVAHELGIRAVSVSVAGDPVLPLAGNAVDEAVAGLVADGIVVLAAAGNDGERRLVPPATAPEALTVGGLDDGRLLDDDERALWHGNYGESWGHLPKPELVGPSLRVVAPLLPGTDAMPRDAWRSSANGTSGARRVSPRASWSRASGRPCSSARRRASIPIAS